MELLIYGPEGEAKRITLENEALSLGRAGDNDLAYPGDPWLSRYHLRFERNGSAWNVKDCESRNGTIVNAASLQAPHALAPGDRIYAGHLTIEVHADPSDTSRGVVSFIPGRGILETRGTVVTNLERVLKQTKEASDKSKRDDVTLTTTRVVDALIRAGQELASHRPLDKIFDVILDLSLSAVDAMRGVILTLEKDGDLEVRASKGDNFAISTSVSH